MSDEIERLQQYIEAAEHRRTIAAMRVWLVGAVLAVAAIFAYLNFVPASLWSSTQESSGSGSAFGAMDYFSYDAAKARARQKLEVLEMQLDGIRRQKEQHCAATFSWDSPSYYYCMENARR
ncbi:MAG: hypothetical protein KDJ47_00330 [Hyphomicrobiaceae bacterium]|nr:hypothetical protein [Hyphomicrobiaceae bacterium]